MVQKAYWRQFLLLLETSEKAVNFTSKPRGYWSADNSMFSVFESLLMINLDDNARDLLEVFAKENGFDPLVPENWYNKSNEFWHAKVYHLYFSLFTYGVGRKIDVI